MHHSASTTQVFSVYLRNVHISRFSAVDLAKTAMQRWTRPQMSIRTRFFLNLRLRSKYCFNIVTSIQNTWMYQSTIVVRIWCSNVPKCPLVLILIPNIKKRRSHDCLIFTMEIPIPGETVFEAGPLYKNTHIADSLLHYIDVIMTTVASQITSLTIVYSIVYSDADQRKHQSSASLAFVRGIHRDFEFPAQRASYAENISIWWRHHDKVTLV